MSQALLLIDIQRDYFPGGAFPLPGADAAADAAARLLESFRARELPVIHVQHVSTGSSAGFFRPGTAGVDHDPRVSPADGETLVVKHHPNAFRGTELQERLEQLAPERLVVAGMMTSMCVDATVRAASDLGWSVAVAGDACAAPDLGHGGVETPALQVHAAFLAALGSAYAEIVAVEELV
ncbi:MAG TPA: cysteine hydrolase family protein [Solirubrobacteraceae bacterium]|nr:cysteine hydrolase family protein [Solirubrobacteraceae bacterium]